MLWDANTATPLATTRSHQTPRAQPPWSSSTTGTHVMLARTDGAVYTWDTGVEHWIEYACGVAGRNLTDTEWRHAFGDRPYRETCPTA